jgi:hypothetical protein
MMRIVRNDFIDQKGWNIVPWNSDFPISVGYAITGIDESHLHQRITEIFLIARGSSVVRVEGEKSPCQPAICW